MKLNNHNFQSAYEYFINRVHKIANKYGKQVIGWNEIWRIVGNKLNN